MNIKRAYRAHTMIVLLMITASMSLTSCRSTRTKKESSKSTYDSTRTVSRAWEKVSSAKRSSAENIDVNASGRIRMEFRYDTGRLVAEESFITLESSTAGKVLGKLINNRLQSVTIDADGTIIDKSNIQINEQEKTNSTGKKSDHTDIAKTEEQTKKDRTTKGVPISVSLGWGIAVIAALAGIILIRIYVPNLFNRKKIES